jgi:hypothetical protein
LRLAIRAAWALRASELAPGEIGALIHMPIVDTTRLREEWGFTCAWSSRAALADMARAAHGRVTLGKKTTRLPWRVPPGSTEHIGKLSAAALRLTYADEVDRVMRDITEVRSHVVGESDLLKSAANQRLLSDLADHAALLVQLGRRHSFGSEVVARAAAVSETARKGVQK